MGAEDLVRRGMIGLKSTLSGLILLMTLLIASLTTVDDKILYYPIHTKEYTTIPIATP